MCHVSLLVNMKKSSRPFDVLRICSRRVGISSCSVAVVLTVLFVGAMVVASDEGGVGWYFRLCLEVVKMNRIHCQRLDKSTFPLWTLVFVYVGRMRKLRPVAAAMQYISKESTDADWPAEASLPLADQ
jgi:hypothetical protein